LQCFWRCVRVPLDHRASLPAAEPLQLMGRRSGPSFDIMVNKTENRMPPPLTPKEVFLALVNGVAEGRWDELPDLYAEQTDVVHPFHPLRAPALRTRDELREHFRPNDASPRLNRKATNFVIHETKDPEVIIAEFEYQGTVEGADEPFSIPGIFVIRVRDGQIVSSRDYLDHLTSARVRGQLDWLVAAMKA
jgi:ketosteroid isomerase-like protein